MICILIRMDKLTSDLEGFHIISTNLKYANCKFEQSSVLLLKAPSLKGMWQTHGSFEIWFVDHVAFNLRCLP